VEQALQEFFFNMNVPTRVGFQTPFTNVTLDLKVPDFMKDEPVIISGRIMDATYGEMEKEMEMFNLAFAKVLSQGDAKGRVFTFPIPTYCITKDFDWDSPVSQEVFEVAAKYGAPYFSNFVNSDMKPEDVRSMCCRLRIDNRELRKRGGGFFGANPLTGSIGVVTINLPRIGYLAKDEDEFFERLENLMELAKDSLEIKRKVLEQFTEKGLYPYSKRYLRGVKETFGKYWKNHFSTIGLVGMNEAILNLFGYSIATPEGLEFAVKVLNFMREKNCRLSGRDWQHLQFGSNTGRRRQL
jgi:ribonucleoside-triphosphate reductase